MTPPGKTREQAAAMIPGAPSYKTLDKIDYLQRFADDPDLPDALRAEARAGLEQIETGNPVDPIYQRLRDIHRDDQSDRDAHLHELATEALNRIKDVKSKKAKSPRRPQSAETEDARYPVRAFVLTWTELASWWLHYDLDDLAAQLTDEQAESFYQTAEGTGEFAERLRAARAQDGERPRLRAI